MDLNNDIGNINVAEQFVLAHHYYIAYCKNGSCSPRNKLTINIICNTGSVKRTGTDFLQVDLSH